jgi:hypothetical protein
MTLNLGGGVVTPRVRLLLEGDPDPARPRPGLRPLAAAMVVLMVLSVASLPAAAHAGLHGASGVAAERPCPA